MNVLVVDTSSWITFFKGTAMPELDLALKEGRVYLPPIVAAELLSSSMGNKERLMFTEFLKELSLCETSFDHWERVGALRAACSTKGLHVSVPDTHVAQCSLDLDGYLLSEDKIFKKLAAITALKLS